MLSLLKRLRHKALILYYKRNYYRSKLIKPHVPYAPLRYLVDGFTALPVEETGVVLVENFCSAAEGESLGSLIDSGAATVRTDPHILPLVVRAAMLAGVPAGNIEVRPANTAADARASGPAGKAVCRVLVGLGAADDSSEVTIRLPELNLSVPFGVGHALIWRTQDEPVFDTNNPGSRRQSLELIAHAKPVGPAMPEPAALQTRPGTPLSGGSKDLLPEGVWTADDPPPV